ncbi:MAG TPA: DNA polymerase III subunit gamma/tau [Aggregatilinea sp.]|uniref:DNA polymerase III subunit gamma/tau n=1 Tax=Aggregatilinea sp. TaxID=2806333 RepID=UPI002BDA57DD|nr:DNA polymerase III subunit gamma/tau [Aggregatilinea sp.]HML24485.1 DNA polymerase III subunit gamma/tau [Aggregatilinea sp.]
MPAQALYLKWRPQTFEDVIGQEHITRTLRNALRQDRVRHAYLFSGPRGTGKTTTARLLAKAVNCAHPDPEKRPCNECSYCVAVNEGRFLDLIEIDAASHTGVDDVRDLRDKIGFAPSEGRYKVYIIDEVHRFSGAAFDALLKTLEEPPAHAIFVLATTEIAKVPATIKSRCLMFEFRRVSLAEVTDRLAKIAEGDHVSIDRAALELVAREGTGSVRDSISLLDQLIADPDEHISLDMAEQLLGTSSGQHVVDLAQALIDADTARGLDLINTTVDSGADPRQFGRQIVEHLRHVLLLKMGGPAMVDVSQERRAAIEQQAAQAPRGALLAAIRAFNGAVQDWQGGWQPQLPLELAFLESLQIGAQPEPAPTPFQGRTQEDLPAPLPATPKPAATPAAPPSPGAATSAQEVTTQWGNIQRVAKRHHPSLPALLDHARPRDVQGDHLILGVKAPVFKVKLEADDKRQALQEAIREVMNVTLEITITVLNEGGGHDQAVDDLLAEDDVLAFGVNELGGEITGLDE